MINITTLSHLFNVGGSVIAIIAVYSCKRRGRYEVKFEPTHVDIDNLLELASPVDAEFLKVICSQLLLTTNQVYLRSNVLCMNSLIYLCIKRNLRVRNFFY